APAPWTEAGAPAACATPPIVTTTVRIPIQVRRPMRILPLRAAFNAGPAELSTPLLRTVVAQLRGGAAARNAPRGLLAQTRVEGDARLVIPRHQHQLQPGRGDQAADHRHGHRLAELGALL